MKKPVTAMRRMVAARTSPRAERTAQVDLTPLCLVSKADQGLSFALFASFAVKFCSAFAINEPISKSQALYREDPVSIDGFSWTLISAI